MSDTAVLREALRRGHVPGEEDAAHAAWPLVMQAYADAPRRPRTRPPLAVRSLLPTLVAAVLAVAAFSAQGDAVATFVKQVVGADSPKPRPASATTLPGGGRLLVAGVGGVFAVGAGRAPQRFFGDVDQATWSAHGRFVAVTRGIELIAISTKGNRRWSLHQRSRILDPAWDPHDGYRIAYRNAGMLHVVNGDGTGDRVVGPAWPVAPVFRPNADHEIAYAKKDRSIVVLRLDTGKEVLHTAPRLHTRSLAWSPSGNRLLALSRDWLWITGMDGRFVRRSHVPAGASNITAAWAPKGDRYAVLRRTATGASQVVLAAGRKGRTLFTLHGALTGLRWSPDGRWLVVADQRADQWLFLRPDSEGRLAAIRTISNVRKRFGSGKTATLQGWCCT